MLFGFCKGVPGARLCQMLGLHQGIPLNSIFFFVQGSIYDVSNAMALLNGRMCFPESKLVRRYPVMEV